eukprot:764562-Hanusia_phi.AAC.3
MPDVRTMTKQQVVNASEPSERRPSAWDSISGGTVKKSFGAVCQVESAKASRLRLFDRVQSSLLKADLPSPPP